MNRAAILPSLRIFMTSFGEGIQILCGNLLQAFTGSDLIELRLNLVVATFSTAKNGAKELPLRP